MARIRVPIPYAPKPYGLGDEVEWLESDGTLRRGQVWSLGDRPSTVWVVPDNQWSRNECVLIGTGKRNASLLLGRYQPATHGQYRILYR